MYSGSASCELFSLLFFCKVVVEGFSGVNVLFWMSKCINILKPDGVELLQKRSHLCSRNKSFVFPFLWISKHIILKKWWWTLKMKMATKMAMMIMPTNRYWARTHTLLPLWLWALGIYRQLISSWLNVTNTPSQAVAIHTIITITTIITIITIIKIIHTFP